MQALARPSRRAQWTVALGMAALWLSLFALCFVLPLLDMRWLALAVVAPFLLTTLESLLLTPLYTLTGRFRYFAPLLLATRRRDGGLDLHVGTLFDYLACLRWRDRGPPAARRVVTDLLRGLLAVCREVERGALRPDAAISATSYFFSDRTAARLGFELHRPSSLAMQNLFVSGFSVAVRLSFTRGRLAFPRLSHTRQAVTTGERLLRHREEIQRLLDHLSRREAADIHPSRADPVDA